MPATIVCDVLPINALINLVADTLLQIGAAAVDLCLEKRSFNELSDLLQSLHAILVKLRDRRLGESPVVSSALESLEQEVTKASAFLRKVKNYSCACRIICGVYISKEFHNAARDISTQLEVLKVSCSEVAFDLVEGIETVCAKLRHTNFVADQRDLAIAEEVDRGIRENRRRRETANFLLNSIARSLGCSQESPQMFHELESLRRDKEDAARNKELQFEYLLGQMIFLLSRADPEKSREKYEELKANCRTSQLEPPLDTFKCLISKNIMVDPVTASNGKVYERKAIAEWFDKNGTTDPDTHDELPNANLRPNRALSECIDGWMDRRTVTLILHAKSKLQSGNEADKTEACGNLSKLCEKSWEYKNWIAFEGLIPLLIEILVSPREQSPTELKETSLQCLHSLVQNNERNKLHFVRADGIHSVIKRCLGKGRRMATLALMVLAEMVNNNDARKMMEMSPSFFLWVVTRRVRDADDDELKVAANHILDQLSDKEDNIVAMLEANWFDPLMNKLCQGTNDDKQRMAFALSRAKIFDDAKQELAKRDVVHALLSMICSLDMESKRASLVALQMLSSSIEVGKFMTTAGAVPRLLDLFSNGSLTMVLLEPAVEIIANLVTNHGSKYLVDTQGLPLHEKVVKLLMEALSKSDPTVDLHALRCLSKLAQGSTSRNMRDLIRGKMQITTLQSFLKHRTPEIREEGVLLLSHLSADEGENALTIFLNRTVTLELLAEQMNHMSSGPTTRRAAAAIVANLSCNHRTISESKPVLQALVGMLASSEANVIESALDALQNLTGQVDEDIKVYLAGLDIFRYLKQTLTSTSSIAKIRAATVVRNFSLSTPSLVASLDANPSVKHHFILGSSWCKVHGGKCQAHTTFCIIKANLVPQLVALLSDPESKVAEASMDALSTLFSHNFHSRYAAQMLSNAQVMKSLPNWFKCESHSCSDKAQNLYHQIEIATQRKPKNAATG